MLATHSKNAEERVEPELRVGDQLSSMQSGEPWNAGGWVEEVHCRRCKDLQGQGVVDIVACHGELGTAGDKEAFEHRVGPKTYFRGTGRSNLVRNNRAPGLVKLPAHTLPRLLEASGRLRRMPYARARGELMASQRAGSARR